MPTKSKTEIAYRCPKCKRNVRPWKEEHFPAMHNASPPIPERVRVRCSAIGCGQRWYIVLKKGKWPVADDH